MKNKEQIKQDLLNTGYFEDNEYLDKYCDLIENNLNTKKEKGKTQEHHIIPRSYYKIINSKVNGKKDNLVNLLFKDHVLVHYYLCLCSKEELIYQLEYAFHYMYSNSNYLDIFKITEEELLKNLDYLETIYKDYCLRQSKKLKGREIKDTTILKMKKAISNRTLEERKEIGRKIASKTRGQFRGPRSQETIDKIKETKRKHPRVPSEWEKKYKSELMKNKNTWTKGRKDNPETLLKKREMRKDTIYIINNDNKMKLWDKNTPIPSGWRRGFRRKTK